MKTREVDVMPGALVLAIAAGGSALDPDPCKVKH